MEMEMEMETMATPMELTMKFTMGAITTLRPATLVKTVETVMEVAAVTTMAILMMSSQTETEITLTMAAIPTVIMAMETTSALPTTRTIMVTVTVTMIIQMVTMMATPTAETGTMATMTSTAAMVAMTPTGAFPTMVTTATIPTMARGTMETLLPTPQIAMGTTATMITPMTTAITTMPTTELAFIPTMATEMTMGTMGAIVTAPTTMKVAMAKVLHNSCWMQLQRKANFLTPTDMLGCSLALCRSLVLRRNHLHTMQVFWVTGSFAQQIP
jgi:hypothetical protein